MGDLPATTRTFGRSVIAIVGTRGRSLEPFARNVPVLWPLLWPVATLIERGPGELLHHYMETGMLKGIKTRTEAIHPDLRVMEVIDA